MLTAINQLAQCHTAAKLWSPEALGVLLSTLLNSRPKSLFPVPTMRRRKKEKILTHYAFCYKT